MAEPESIQSVEKRLKESKRKFDEDINAKWVDFDYKIAAADKMPHMRFSVADEALGGVNLVIPSELLVLLTTSEQDTIYVPIDTTSKLNQSEQRLREIRRRNRSQALFLSAVDLFDKKLIVTSKVD